MSATPTPGTFYSSTTTSGDQFATELDSVEIAGDPWWADLAYFTVGSIVGALAVALGALVS